MLKMTTRLGLLSFAVAFTVSAVPALADEPKINAQQLAVVDRALEFCGPVDEDSAKKLKDKVAELTKGASADTVAQARSSEAYTQAYSSIGGFFGEIDPRNAKVACTNTADAKNTAGRK